MAVHEGGTELEAKLSLSTMEVCFICVAWEFSGSKSNYLCSRHLSCSSVEVGLASETSSTSVAWKLTCTCAGCSIQVSSI